MEQEIAQAYFPDFEFEEIVFVRVWHWIAAHMRDLNKLHLKM